MSALAKDKSKTCPPFIIEKRPTLSVAPRLMYKSLIENPRPSKLPVKVPSGSHPLPPFHPEVAEQSMS
ncbi:MAG TPA: hypothetical protein P5052_03690 [Candidatus Paceibacterota bacterium]|jgi:hypothetical protein|nr:hypothetical protein [Candidatus Paceibacterota bacterium]HRZ29823.1 hypothetical protein [Candidatus Paceibacterota bacterium]